MLHHHSSSESFLRLPRNEMFLKIGSANNEKTSKPENCTDLLHLRGMLHFLFADISAARFSGSLSYLPNSMENEARPLESERKLPM